MNKIYKQDVFLWIDVLSDCINTTAFSMQAIIQGVTIPPSRIIMKKHFLMVILAYERMFHLFAEFYRYKNVYGIDNLLIQRSLLYEEWRSVITDPIFKAIVDDPELEIDSDLFDLDETEAEEFKEMIALNIDARKTFMEKLSYFSKKPNTMHGSIATSTIIYRSTRDYGVDPKMIVSNLFTNQIDVIEKIFKELSTIDNNNHDSYFEKKHIETVLPLLLYIASNLVDSMRVSICCISEVLKELYESNDTGITEDEYNLYCNLLNVYMPEEHYPKLKEHFVKITNDLRNNLIDNLEKNEAIIEDISNKEPIKKDNIMDDYKILDDLKTGKLKLPEEFIPYAYIIEKNTETLDAEECVILVRIINKTRILSSGGKCGKESKNNCKI